jgi:hypothetical protein
MYRRRRGFGLKDYRLGWRLYPVSMILVHTIFGGFVAFLVLLDKYQQGEISPYWCGIALTVAIIAACTASATS